MPKTMASSVCMYGMKNFLSLAPKAQQSKLHQTAVIRDRTLFLKEINKNMIMILLFITCDSDWRQQTMPQDYGIKRTHDWHEKHPHHWLRKRMNVCMYTCTDVCNTRYLRKWSKTCQNRLLFVLSKSQHRLKENWTEHTRHVFRGLLKQNRACGSGNTYDLEKQLSSWIVSQTQTMNSTLITYIHMG